MPVAPKIWVDWAARFLNIPIEEILRDPALAMSSVAQAAVAVGSDMARLFLFPSRRVKIVDGECYQLQGNEEVGPLDTQGGWATTLIEPKAFDLAAPEHLAHYQFWRSHRPWVEEESALSRLSAPSAQFYESYGYGSMVDAVKRMSGERLTCVGDCGSGTLSFLVALRGIHQALIDIIDTPHFAHRCMELGVQIAVEKAKFFINRGVTVLRYNDSVANMSVISPLHWRQFVQPWVRLFCSEVHRLEPRAKVYCHMCGNIAPVLPDLVATGLDCISPLDPLGGFSVANARNIVGNDVVLMGGVNTLTLANGTPEQVMSEAHNCIQQGGELGKYILGSGCAVPSITPAENLLALNEAVVTYNARGM